MAATLSRFIYLSLGVASLNPLCVGLTYGEKRKKRSSPKGESFYLESLITVIAAVKSAAFFV
jgi:hypothetical protein